MTRAAMLVELGERYAALGLVHAARAVFLRALALADKGDASPAYRLAELALATGDPHRARDHAREAVRREPGPNARLLLGRAQLAAGEIAAARLSLTAVIEAAGHAPRLRAHAHLSLARAAAQSGDRAGADANTMAAVAALCELAASAEQGRSPDDSPAPESAAQASHEAVAAELAFVQALFAHAAGAGLAKDAHRYLDELEGRAPHAPVTLLRALLLAAAQNHGDSAIADRDIDGALAAAIAEHPAAAARPIRILAIERRLRRRHRDSAARDQSILALQSLIDELSAYPPSLAGNIEMARLLFLLAELYAEDPAARAQAEDLYRASIARWPGHRAAASRLAALLLAHGSHDAALAAVERALVIDAELGPAWHSAAQVLESTGTGPGGLVPALARMLEAAAPGAGQAAEPCAKLAGAVAETARQSALESLFPRGHRLKNVLGIIGARARSARKAASGELGDRLAELERDITALYEEWATYLRAMQASEATFSPVMEIVLVDVLVSEVVEAGRAAASVPITLHLAPVPSLRGDRLLLRDALVNLVTNAAQAAAQTAGSVEVSVRPRPQRAPDYLEPAGVEIEIADTGPGIPRADLARMFVPGFTTKSTGSGVGLTVAERVISAHRGRIAVESEEGRGTRITVVLPTELLDVAAFAGAPLGSMKLR